MLIRFDLEKEEEPFLKMGSDLQSLKEEEESFDLQIPITSDEELFSLGTLPIQINNIWFPTNRPSKELIDEMFGNLEETDNSLNDETVHSTSSIAPNSDVDIGDNSPDYIIKGD